MNNHNLTYHDRVNRFMSRVEIDPTTGCWLWQGEIKLNGYGECWCFGRREMAHQADFRELKREVLGQGQIIRHTCDNPRCCNPDHLLGGTQADNIRDKVLRSRQAKGESHGCAKLKSEDVLAIRASSLSQRSLARQFNVTQPLIGMIKRREKWTHI